jgi:molybdate transport system substrate-binding protein
MRRAALAVVLVAALGAGAARGAPEKQVADRPIVLAAASLTEVLPRIVPDGRYSFGSSNALAEQIRRGAPLDVYLSASPLYSQALHGQGLVRKPVAFATNSLVVIVPRSNPARIRSIADLAKRPKLRLVVASTRGKC